MYFFKFLIIPLDPLMKIDKYSEENKSLNVTYTLYTFNDRIYAIKNIPLTPMQIVYLV